jgi:hypothetical protein
MNRRVVLKERGANVGQTAALAKLESADDVFAELAVGVPG